MRFAFYSRKRIRRADERGYAMLLALSLTLILLISSTAIIANLRTEGKRQREEETIWRGNQYARAIQLYFHKTGHYPQTLDDLKKGLPQHHFLRQAYTDPMNKNDGSWRFIYVNAAGQIIGSTKYTSLQQMALLDSGALNGPQAPGLGTPASSLTNTSGFGGLSGGAFGNSSSGSAQNPPVALPDPNASPQTPGGDGGGAPGQVPGQVPDPTAQNPDGTQPQAPTSGQGPGQPSGQPGASGTGIGGAGAQSPFGSLNGQPGTSIDTQKPTGPVDGPVLGAFLTGVASKVDEPSQKVYHHGKKYIQWEFIWNPLEEAAANMQQSLNPQGQQSGIGQAIGSALGLPGSSPIGSPSPGQPQQPQMPQQSPQQPQQ